MHEMRVVGKSLPRLDARAKVTGKAVYAVGFSLPGMLHGKILRSTQPHALIRRLDVRRARQLPGVRAVVSAQEVPMVYVGGLLLDDTPLIHPDWRQYRTTGNVFRDGNICACSQIRTGNVEAAMVQGRWSKSPIWRRIDAILPNCPRRKNSVVRSWPTWNPPTPTGDRCWSRLNAT